MELAIFAGISRNTFLLRQKNNFEWSLFYKPFKEFSQIQAIVFGWNYISLLFLITGMFAKSTEVETFLGFCRAFYTASLCLGFLLYCRAFLLMCFFGVSRALHDLLFFIFVNSLPIFVIEAFGGVQLT